MEFLNKLSQIAYTLEEDAERRQLKLRHGQVHQLRENLVYVLKMHQEGVESDDYEWLPEYFKQRILTFLLNPMGHGTEQENN